jgi:hypothetical protein
VAHNKRTQQVRFAQSARRHRIGKTHVLAVLENAGDPTIVPAESDDLDDRLLFVGVDDRGIELEIIAVQLPDFLYVIHVMPTQFRR